MSHRHTPPKLIPLDKKKSRVKERKRLPLIKGQVEITDHHRRPRSIGGSKDPANISKISIRIHKAWHIIFGNMSAEQICNYINENFKPKGLTLVCTFINGRQCLMQGNNKSNSSDLYKISLAWNTLFEKNLSFKKKIDFINNVLLDPAYHFYIRD